MKITPKILSIPPHLSTEWENVLSLQTKGQQEDLKLVVTLKNGMETEIPNLSKETIEEIFEFHAQGQIKKSGFPLSSAFGDSAFSFSLPIAKDKDGGLADLTPTLQHNPEQANFPPFPPQVLDRIQTITKAFGLEDLAGFAEPQPNCNCPYCQIAKAVGKKCTEEIVSDEDLTFRDLWEVVQVDGSLYTVTNTLDSEESYSVFLGSPLGCTCGEKNCEHIQAALKT